MEGTNWLAFVIVPCMIQETVPGITVNVPAQAANPWTIAGPILGAIVGGAASLIGTLFVLRTNSRLEREKQNREDATRYNLERAQAYAKFVSLVDNARNLFPVEEAGRAELTKADYDEFRDALWESSTKIHLLSSEPLRTQTRKLTGITIDFLNEQDEDKRSAILQRRDEEELIKTFLSRAQEEIAIDKLLDQPQQQGQ